jgi:hypothetical protein
MPGGMQFSLTPTRIMQGRITDVDCDRWCLEVGKLFTVERMMDVPFATPYVGFKGEGINFMPEVGGVVWICDPSDSRQSFVLAWSPPARTKEDFNGEGGARPDFTCNRQKLNPGDISLTGADRNFVTLRRGGLLELGANKLCQRVFIPVGNIIRDIAQRYEIQTIPGELKFECASNEDHKNGKAPTRIRVTAKKYANDEKDVAEMILGEDPDAPGTGVISLKVFDTALGGLASCEIKLKETGDLTCTMLKGTLTVKAKAIALTALQAMTFTAGALLTLSAPQLAIACSSGGGGINFPGDGSVGLKASRIKMQSSNVELCEGATESVMKGDTAFQWILSHRHIIPNAGFTGAVDPSQMNGLKAAMSTKVKTG